MTHKRLKSLLRRLSCVDGTIFISWVRTAGKGKFERHMGSLSAQLKLGISWMRLEYTWKLTEVDQRTKRGIVLSDQMGLQISNKIITLLLSKPTLILS